MEKLSKIKITKFQNMTAKTGKSILLFHELRSIKDGTYKNLITQCRNALHNGNEILYGELKTKLPAVTFCGEFTKKRKASEITTYNNLMVLDIDHVIEEKLLEAKKHLASDKFILSFWDSPSGRGIKCLIRIDSNKDKHKAIFNSLEKYFADNYEIEIDPSGKDISRLCFSSWDEHIYYNPNAEIYADFVEDEKKIKTNTTTYTKNITLLKSAHATEGLNKAEDTKIVRQIIKYLTKKNISITSTYDEWLKVSFAIASAFSYDVGEKFFLALCTLDQQKHDETKSINLLKSSYNKRKLDTDGTISIATIIFFAKSKGFQN